MLIAASDLHWYVHKQALTSTKVSAVSIHLHPLPFPVPLLIHNNPPLSPSSIKAWSYRQVEAEAFPLQCYTKETFSVSVWVGTTTRSFLSGITRHMIREHNLDAEKPQVTAFSRLWQDKKKSCLRFSKSLPVTSAYTVNLSSLAGNRWLVLQKHRQVGVVTPNGPEGLNLR